GARLVRAAQKGRRRPRCRHRPSLGRLRARRWRGRGREDVRISLARRLDQQVACRRPLSIVVSVIVGRKLALKRVEFLDPRSQRRPPVPASRAREREELAQGGDEEALAEEVLRGHLAETGGGGA